MMVIKWEELQYITVDNIVHVHGMLCIVLCVIGLDIENGIGMTNQVTKL